MTHTIDSGGKVYCISGMWGVGKMTAGEIEWDLYQLLIGIFALLSKFWLRILPFKTPGFARDACRDNAYNV